MFYKQTNTDGLESRYWASCGLLTRGLQTLQLSHKMADKSSGKRVNSNFCRKQSSDFVEFTLDQYNPGQCVGRK